MTPKKNARKLTAKDLKACDQKLRRLDDAALARAHGGEDALRYSTSDSLRYSVDPLRYAIEPLRY